MASYNRIILVGNLTRDPELSYTPSNTAVCKFAVATNHKWKDRDGNEREEVCFVDCTLFGKGGEVLNKYMSKGRALLVEGRLLLERWTNQEGQKRSKHSVFVENFKFMDSQRSGGGGPDRGANRDQGHSGGSGYGESRDQGQGGGGYSTDDSGPSYDDSAVPASEDIPF